MLSPSLQSFSWSPLLFLQFYLITPSFLRVKFIALTVYLSPVFLVWHSSSLHSVFQLPNLPSVLFKHSFDPLHLYSLPIPSGLLSYTFLTKPSSFILLTCPHHLTAPCHTYQSLGRSSNIYAFGIYAIMSVTVWLLMFHLFCSSRPSPNSMTLFWRSTRISQFCMRWGGMYVKVNSKEMRRVSQGEEKKIESKVSGSKVNKNK